jgi:Family of unknown function (DUF6088)
LEINYSFSNIMARPIAASSLPSRILTTLETRGGGYVFSSGDFAELGARGALDMALKRLAAAGRIRRVARGFYEYPRAGALVSSLPPDPDSVARAVARRFGARIIPTGAFVANQPGISAQTTDRHVYLTDGPSKRLEFDRGEVELRHHTVGRVAVGGAAAAVIEALRSLKTQGVNDEVLMFLRSRLAADDRASLLTALRLAPAWMRSHLKRIAESAD